MRLKAALSLALLAGLAACGRSDDEGTPDGTSNSAIIPTSETDNVGAPPKEPIAPVRPSPAPLDLLNGVKVGMTIADMRAKGLKVSHDAGPDPDSTCSYAKVDGMPDVSFMLEGPKVARIDVASPLFKTVGGVQVGLGEPEAIKRLGSAVVVQPHPYTGPEGHYLIVHEKGARLGLIFETDGKSVISYRIGRWEQVQWVEGCS